MSDLAAELNDTNVQECLALITAAVCDDDVPSEHRFGPRKRVTRKVDLAVRSGVSGLGPDLGAGLVDMTQDGLGLRLKELVPVGTEVTIDLSLPGIDKRLRVLAEVRWCRQQVDGKFRAGVRLKRRLSFPTLTNLTE
jgi:hypothetical protein